MEPISANKSAAGERGIRVYSMPDALALCLSTGVMRKEIALPKSWGELLERLFTIFPQYREGYDGPIHYDAPTFHSVLIGFSSFPLAACPEAELREFGTLASAAVEDGGALGNAFETCALEHLHQTRAARALRPYLSKIARGRTKA
jgi:hypothetical protein